MSTDLEIESLCGELVFSGRAEEGWSVHDLKCALNRLTGVPCGKQKLFNSTGDVLQDPSPLCHYFCPAHLDGAQRLSFVEMPKTDAEIEHYECWLNETPACWQKSTEVVFTCSELAWAKCWTRASLRGKSEWKFVDRQTTSPKPLPFTNATAEPERLFEESGELIKAVKDGQVREIKACCAEWAHHSAKDSFTVELTSRKKAWVSRAVLFQAIERDAEMLMHYLDDAAVLATARKIPRIFKFISDRLKDDRTILYAALECDAALQTEFLTTSGKSEVNAWLWYAEQEGLKVVTKLSKAASSKQRKDRASAAAAAASAAAVAAAGAEGLSSRPATMTKEAVKRSGAKALPSSGAQRRDRLPMGRGEAAQAHGVKCQANTMRLRNTARSRRA